MGKKVTKADLETKVVGLEKVKMELEEKVSELEKAKKACELVNESQANKVNVLTEKHEALKSAHNAVFKDFTRLSLAINEYNALSRWAKIKKALKKGDGAKIL